MQLVVFLILLMSNLAYADNYAVIDKKTNTCVNIVEWDGITKWTPPEGTFAVKSVEIGKFNEAKQVDGKWVRQLTAQDLKDIVDEKTREEKKVQ